MKQFIYLKACVAAELPTWEVETTTFIHMTMAQQQGPHNR